MSETLAKTIGEVARSARQALGLTQQDAAEGMGISLEFYARMERGRALPSVPTLVKMAHVLKRRPDQLLGQDLSTGGASLAASPRPSYGNEDPPELRRLIRRLRSEKPRTLRLLGLVISEITRIRSEAQKKSR